MKLFNLLTTYVPGIQWLLILLLAHVITATAAHIRAKDFKFSEWTNYMINFIFFVGFIAIVNGVVSTSKQLNNNVLSAVFLGLQTIAYGQVIVYYIDNIDKT